MVLAGEMEGHVRGAMTEVDDIRGWFAEFQADRVERLRVALRRRRVRQLQDLIRGGEVTLDVFNQEIWPFESSSTLDGEPFNVRRFFDEWRPPETDVARIEAALAGEKLVLRGNY